MKEESEGLLCVGCENIICNYWSIYKGCSLCQYCLEDWFKARVPYDNFDSWIYKQRLKMLKDREK